MRLSHLIGNNSNWFDFGFTTLNSLSILLHYFSRWFPRKNTSRWIFFQFFVGVTNTNNLITCKLHICFFFVFHEMQTERKYDQRQHKRKSKTRAKERKINSLWLCLILPKCSVSANCAHAHRETSSLYRGHFRFL